MSEYRHHALHSGSRTGPLVRSYAQAVAIALSEQRRADAVRKRRRRRVAKPRRRVEKPRRSKKTKCRKCGK